MNRSGVAIPAAGALSLLLSVGALAVGGPAFLVEDPLQLEWLLWPATAALAILLLALQRHGFVYYWRSQSTKVSLDEIGVFIGLLVLPPAALVVAVGTGAAVNQILHRRALPKAVFNVGQYASAALVTAAICGALRAAGLPTPWSALPGPLLFYALTAFQVSVRFAEIERSSAFRVFSRRFGRLVLVGAALAASLGLVIVALYTLHPVAVLAAVPIFLALRRFGRLSEWADDEITTHRLVASVSTELAGRHDLDHVARRILATCHDLVDCGQAILTMRRDVGEPRVWRSDDGASASPGGVAADILGPDGSPVGALHVYPKAGQQGYGEREQQLLRTIASAIAATAANADALRRAEEANAELADRERRLRNMNRELEQFTLWTTHDMREPLRSIGTITQCLYEDIGTIGPAEARDLARRINDGADRLKERVKALHAFSMIVQRDDGFEDVDMQRVLEHVVASLETKIREKSATVALPVARLPVVRAQPHRIDQVFGNLVENALKYGRESGAVVEIGCEESEDEWRFVVRDNGPGIPAGFHERIFQLFQRGPEPAEPGSGAGLAIVKRIAEQHGGRAWAENGGSGGACFVIALPKPAPIPVATLSKAF